MLAGVNANGNLNRPALSGLSNIGPFGSFRAVSASEEAARPEGRAANNPTGALISRIRQTVPC